MGGSCYINYRNLKTYQIPTRLKAHLPILAERVCTKNGRYQIQNVLPERKQVRARENITMKSTKDTKGNQIEKILHDLCVLRGRQVL
jgi:hypothetical protein